MFPASLHPLANKLINFIVLQAGLSLDDQITQVQEITEQHKYKIIPNNSHCWNTEFPMANCTSKLIIAANSFTIISNAWITGK